MAQTAAIEKTGKFNPSVYGEASRFSAQSCFAHDGLDDDD